ncbi:Uncharacterized protein OBRU01_15509 [Operophtera brumata]|uniref:Spondin domain-containing protein n=1 Tax=Operophtera brumata TaxID=104452 RepID=A0A0L7L4W0_OPEBR|nr:Uncharacterized protein OBRU01_15509 [Operophtera brumata]
MKVWKRLAAILVLVLIAVTSGCDVNDVAVYKVSLRMMWSEERFPKDYPEFWPKAQWSRVFAPITPPRIARSPHVTLFPAVDFRLEFCYKVCGTRSRNGSEKICGTSAEAEAEAEVRCNTINYG